jgi:hypothetical protein
MGDVGDRTSDSFFYEKISIELRTCPDSRPVGKSGGASREMILSVATPGEGCGLGINHDVEDVPTPHPGPPQYREREK